VHAAEIPRVLLRTALGALVAAIIALAARRLGALSSSGAAAAVVVGTACVAAGWRWGALLIAFFVVSSALSRVGREVKRRRLAGIIEKEGARDATQVLANGGVYTLTALAAAATGSGPWSAAALGVLATSTADTWGTEVGTLAGGTPRSVLSGRRIQPGMSGGITLRGSLATAAGAAFIAGVAWMLGWGGGEAAAAAGGGIVGAFADSILGASIQERRWCDVCSAPTERLVHPCGTPTRPIGGLQGFRNDAVNLSSGLIGGLVSALLILR
jgi:uncharacterized protein (TIGR00297 family)